MTKCADDQGIPTITDCVLAELEKLGPKYRLALRIAKDPRFERLHCDREQPVFSPTPSLCLRLSGQR
jgi:rRNA-processing protein FCF1